MKYRFLKTGLAIAALFMQSNTQAQLVPPSNSDILWTPGGGAGINTSLIDVVDPLSDDKNRPYKQLGACAYNNGVVVTDFRSGFQLNAPYPFAMAGIPDVTWGNKGMSTVDFILAVAYANMGGNVEVDYFDVHYTTPVTFTILYNSSTLIAPPSFSYLLGTVHIDVVAKSSIMTPWGLPYCDPVFVTYDVGSGYNVYTTYGTLNTYNAVSTGPQRITLLCPGITAPESWQPDVAGIEREIPSGSGSYYDIACLTYVTQNNGGLYYSEWNPVMPGCAGLSPYFTLQGTGGGPTPDPSYYHPRIDANDNYVTNGSGVCQSKVVCEYSDTLAFNHHMQIGVYNYPVFGGTTTSLINVHGLEYPVGSGFYPFLAPCSPKCYDNFAPAVAYGQNFFSEYMVTQCAVPPGGWGDFFMMSPIDAPCSSGLGGYYEVNLTYPAASSNHANSVSTPCNNVTDTSIVAWTHAGAIWYKRTLGPGYSYKTTPGTSPSFSTFDKITIFPNPADNYLTVGIPVHNGADRYNIKNILGQVVLDGSIETGEQQLNVSKLPEGNYVISFFDKGTTAGNKIFVKK